jgi:hypothetical protein
MCYADVPAAPDREMGRHDIAAQMLYGRRVPQGRRDRSHKRIKVG